MKEELIDVRKRINLLMGDEEEKEYAQTYYNYEHYYRKLPGYVPKDGPPRQSFKHGLSIPMELDRYVVAEERKDDFVMVDSYGQLTGQSTDVNDLESTNEVRNALFNSIMPDKGSVCSEDDLLVYMRWIANSVEEELFHEKEPTESRAIFVHTLEALASAFGDNEQTDTSD
jgi:hypothetical protein